MKTQILAISVLSAFAAGTTLQARPPRMPQPPPADEVVVEMFATYDTDESNTLNSDELVAAFVGIRATHMAKRAEEGLCPNPNGPRRGMVGQGRGLGRGKGRGPGPRNPADFAPALVQEFDTDGDAALNTAEALAAITYMHETRGSRRFSPPPIEDETGEEADESTE